MKDRPLGVSILAALHLLGGVGLLVMQIWLFSDFGRVAAGLSEVGIPPVLLILGMLLLSGLTLASGIGMWLGTRWGWWLATFYYVYSIARNANALLTVISLNEEIAGGPRGPGYYYFKFVCRIVIHSLLLLYFFKANVLQYFGMSGVHHGKAIGAHVTAVAVIGGIATVASLFAG